MFERLDYHQARVVATLCEWDALIAWSAPDAAELGRVRWALARQLREYQIYKHAEVFAPALASGDPDARRMAAALKAACVAAGEQATAFIMAWSGRGGPEHWNEYRRASLRINEDIRRHVANERRAVNVLAELLTRHAKRDRSGD